ncbi:MAG: GNAT family N-acetyltransferase [Anaerolineae bacterium]|nr:GNAT family N-acetyltransferase [Anaerolineae bacterium]
MHIRPIAPHEWQRYKALRLRALADAPDAFGTVFADAIQQRDDFWIARVSARQAAAKQLPLLAETDGQAVGLAWGHIADADPSCAHIFQVWVAPSHRGLGVGQQLIMRISDWANSHQAEYLDLSVTCGDTPAVRLYRRLGFEPYGEPQPLRPGSALLVQPMRLRLAKIKPAPAMPLAHE